MLDPQDRQLLLETLRPTDGYQLDRAIGTSFSLDLVALVTAPLAFTLFAMDEDGGRPSAHPLALLEAVRRHADRIHIFCQGGQIKVPPANQLLVEGVEDCVIEVQAPIEGGVFHPKVWLLRYIPVEGSGPIRYRLICLSRNLTFDRSWDTVLVLDGELVDRTNAFARNHPLGDFIAALPDLAIREVPQVPAETAELFASEVRRVDFVPPDEFDEIAFWPLGVGASRFPFEGRIDRLLVISPFLSTEGLRKIRDRRDGDLLVSRKEALDEVGANALAGFEATLALSDRAEPEPTETDVETTPEPMEMLTGLHAKVYAADAGWNARLWVGSANATDAALTRNVEFLVELNGKKSTCGIDAILGEGRSGLRPMLEPWQAAEEPALDELGRRLEQRADAIKRELAALQLVARVGPGSDDDYGITIERASQSAALPDLTGASGLSCWPVTLREGAHARSFDLQRNPPARFEGMSLQEITAFVAFRLVLQSDGRELTTSFVLKLELLDAPLNRHEAVLRALLQNQGDFVRYLMLLLSEGDPATEASAFVEPPGRKGGEGPRGPSSGAGWTAPILETMIRALNHNPTALDEVAAVVEELKGSEETSRLLPPGFDRVWDPIWEARKEFG